MKLFSLTALFVFFVGISAIPAMGFDIMIGDNDGYGYGVPDGANLPNSSFMLDYPWIFDNRSASELAASDGSQHTDYEPILSPRSFKFNFTPGLGVTAAVFEVDVSGIETAFSGSSSVTLDGFSYSFLPLEQGTFGSGVYSTVVDPALLTDGSLTVEFRGGLYDAIAFDYFKLRVTTVPEPTSMLLFGVGLVGVAGVRRFRK